jgi:myosin heavy subunit
MVKIRKKKKNFVRCIIKKNEKSDGKIDEKIVIEKMRCKGVIEGISI